MMMCMKCGGDVSGFHHEVKLTIICESCVSSGQLVTKTESIVMGAKENDISNLRCMYKINPHYRSGPKMRLYVREEVCVFADIKNERKRAYNEKSDNANETKETKRIIVKKARLDCYNKRLGGIQGSVPTPGLVTGDFCSMKTKTPKVSTKILVKRRALWNRCINSGVPVAVRVFNWATSNKELDTTVPEALDAIDHEEFLFTRVATIEGHRILDFLGEKERVVLLRTNPVFEESIHGLPVANIPSDMMALCEKLGDLMNIPFERVVCKMEESHQCWVYRYINRITPKRLSFILRPHFLGNLKKKEMLLEHKNESFLRWGLSPDDNTFRYVHVDYFKNDIVDVELLSAMCYMSKHDVCGISSEKIVTKRVMETPGATWIAVTKEYVEKEIFDKKMRICESSEITWMRMEDKYFRSTIDYCMCGILASIACSNSQCGDCCEGPCYIHNEQ